VGIAAKENIIKEKNSQRRFLILTNFMGTGKIQKKVFLENFFKKFK